MDVYTEVPERFLKMFLDELKDEGWIIEKLDIENDDAIASNGVYYIIIAPLYDRKEISNLNNTKKNSHYKWRVFIYYDNFFLDIICKEINWSDERCFIILLLLKEVLA